MNDNGRKNSAFIEIVYRIIQIVTDILKEVKAIPTGKLLIDGPAVMEYYGFSATNGTNYHE